MEDGPVQFECNCFTAGTTVQTKNWDKPIEEIKAGDMVLAKDDKTGEVAYKEVTGLFQKQAKEIFYVHVGNEVIEGTGEHPFWLDGSGWTYVKDLKVGDLLVSSDGRKLSIDLIEKENRNSTVYNLESKISTLTLSLILEYGFITARLRHIPLPLQAEQFITELGNCSNE